jgi:hypothetical protein
MGRRALETGQVVVFTDAHSHHVESPPPGTPTTAVIEIVTAGEPFCINAAAMDRFDRLVAILPATRGLQPLFDHLPSEVTWEIRRARDRLAGTIRFALR